ncbi:MAG: hypothetical protein IJ007_05615 [Oscillospiraceae bacterium]|nr:hypothetical protein [Oscillospiraceae bacterium]
MKRNAVIKIDFYSSAYSFTKEISAADLAELYDRFIKEFPQSWVNCSGCLIERFEDNILTERVTVYAYEPLGLSVTYEKMRDRKLKDGRSIRVGEQFLAVFDKTKLDRVVEVYCELDTSEGLLMPPENAWKGISHFIEKGGMSPELEWITPDIIPESGNWC